MSDAHDSEEKSSSQHEDSSPESDFRGKLESERSTVAIEDEEEIPGPDISSPEEIARSFGYDLNIDHHFRKPEFPPPPSRPTPTPSPTISTPEEIEASFDAEMPPWRVHFSKFKDWSKPVFWPSEIYNDWEPVIERLTDANWFYAKLQRRVLKKVWSKDSTIHTGLAVGLYTKYMIEASTMAIDRMVLFTAQELADEFHLSRQHVTRHIKQLEEDRAFRRRKRTGQRGPGIVYKVPKPTGRFVVIPGSLVGHLKYYRHLILTYSGLCSFARVHDPKINGKVVGLGTAIVSDYHLAKTVGLGESTVRKHLGELRDIGYIAVNTEGRKRTIYLPDLALIGHRWREDMGKFFFPKGPDRTTH